MVYLSRQGVQRLVVGETVIIGHGDIAGVLPDRPDRLFFASGVSNSRETFEPAYQRERDLLMRQERGAHLVYFSSLCIFYADTRYAQHKRQMEYLVQCEFKQHCIIRLGNITWGTNPHTLINFMRGQLARGETLEIQEAYRYLVDEDEFLYWVRMVPNFACEMNIPGQRLKVVEIVKRYVL